MPNLDTLCPDHPPPAQPDHLRPPSRRSSGQHSHHQPPNQPPPTISATTTNRPKSATTTRPINPTSTTSPAMEPPSPGHLRPPLPPEVSPPEIHTKPGHKPISSPSASLVNPVEEHTEKEEEDYGHGFIATGGSFGKTTLFERIQARKHIEACEHELLKANPKWKKKAKAVNGKDDLLEVEEPKLMEVEEEETPVAVVAPEADSRQQMKVALAGLSEEQAEILEVDAILREEEKKLVMQSRGPAEGRPENHPGDQPAVKERPAAATSKGLAGGRPPPIVPAISFPM